MTKQVLLRVKGIQTDIGTQEEPEVIELLTHGTLSDKGNGCFEVSYDETSITGLEGTRTTFEISPNVITLHRSGTFCSKMVFERGGRHHSVYETPYGHLSMGISTQHIASHLTFEGGTVEFDYNIEIEHGMVGERSFHITVSEQPNS